MSLASTFYYILSASDFCQHLFPNRMRTRSSSNFSSSTILQATTNKRETNKQFKLQHSNLFQLIQAPTFKFHPTNSKLQHSNLLQRIHSHNIQISSNKFKLHPTSSIDPTKPKLHPTSSKPICQVQAPSDKSKIHLSSSKFHPTSPSSIRQFQSSIRQFQSSIRQFQSSIRKIQNSIQQVQRSTRQFQSSIDKSQNSIQQVQLSAVNSLSHQLFLLLHRPLEGCVTAGMVGRGAEACCRAVLSTLISI